MIKINYKKCLNKENLKYLPFLVIIVFTLLPIAWHQPGAIISGGDYHYPLDAKYDFLSRTFAWNANFLAGTDRSMDMPGLFWAMAMALLSLVGFSSSIAQTIFLCFLTFNISFAIYLLASRFFKGKHIAISMTVFFYCFSYYQFHNFEIVRLGEISATTLLPVMVAVCYDIITKSRLTLKNLLIWLYFSFLCGGIGIQPPVLIVTFGFSAAFALYYLIKTHGRNIKFMFFDAMRIILVPVIFFLINFFWLLPVFFYTMQANYMSSANSIFVFSVFDLLNWTSAHTGLLNLFKFLPRTVWFSSWSDQPYYPCMMDLGSSWLSIIGIIIFMTALISLFGVSAKKKKSFDYADTIFFAFFMLVSIFLSKGLHKPFGEVYKWLIINVPVFWIYRAPYEKFGLLYLLSIAILIGQSIKFLSEKYVMDKSSGKKRHRKKIKNGAKRILLLFKRPKYQKNFFICAFIIILVFMNIFFTYPFIKGKMFPSSEGEYGYHESFNVGYYQNYPSYLFDAADYVNKQKGHFNIMLTPDQKSHVYWWGYGSATDISYYLFNKGLLFRQYGEGTAPPSSIDKMYNVVQKLLYTNSNTNLYKILNKLNVKYVLQRNDFRYDFFGNEGGYVPTSGDSPVFMKDVLKNQHGLSLAKTFGKWDFYELKETSPLIYGTDNLFSMNSSNDLEGFLTSCDDLFMSQDFYYESELSGKNMNTINANKNYEGMSKFLSKNTNYELTEKERVNRIINFEYGLQDLIINYDSKDGVKSSIMKNAAGIGNKFLRINNSGFGSYIHHKSAYDLTQFDRFSYGLKYRLQEIEEPAELHFIFDGYSKSKHIFTLTYHLFSGDYPPQISISEDGSKSIHVFDSGNRNQSWNNLSINPYDLISNMTDNFAELRQVNHLDIDILNWADGGLVVDLDDITLQGITGKVCRQINRFGKGDSLNANLKFVKISPVKYEVYVDSPKDFILVFSQLYSPNWKIFMEKIPFSIADTALSSDYEHSIFDVKYLFKNPFDAPHFKINGYANAWYLDEKDISNASAGNNYKLVIFFVPQAYFYLGFIFVILILIIILFLILKKYSILNYLKTLNK